MTPAIAFFPHNPHHAKFFSLVAQELKRKYDITSLFIREVGPIENQEVFEFENELERIWDALDISGESLGKLQAQYPDFNFMRALYSEREFNFYPQYFGDQAIGYDHQLRYMVGCFKIFELWLGKNEISCVVSELIIGLADSVLKEVCDSLGILYVSVRQSKMIPGVVVCDPYYDVPRDMMEIYAEFLGNGIPKEFLKPAQQHIDELRKKISHPSYMEVTKKPFRLISSYKVKEFIKRLSTEKIPVCRVSARRHPVLNPIRWSLYKWLNIRRSAFSFDRWFSKDIPYDIKYLVYPLHYEPEASTSVRAFYFSDQMALIRLLVKLLPIGVYLVVKEHGGNQGYRKSLFYKELYYIPNVILLGPRYDVSTLLKNCLGVITLTGRMGWEGLVNNKPVITLGQTFWTFFEGIDFVHSWKDIKVAIDRVVSVSGTGDIYNEEKLLAYTAAYISCVKDASFVANSPLFFSEENINNFAKVICSQAQKMAQK